MIKAVEHFKTITRHKGLVMKYCFKIGLYKQGLLHDMSKYSSVEFFAGVKYYQGNQSPNNEERRVNGLSRAWLHHKGRNLHHYEYWIDYDMSSERVLAGMRMPRRYVAEMIVDRMCACMVYEKDHYTCASPLHYYLLSSHKMWFIHPEVKREMEYLLRMMARKGEDYTFAYMRKRFLKGKSLSKSYQNI